MPRSINRPTVGQARDGIRAEHSWWRDVVEGHDSDLRPKDGLEKVDRPYDKNRFDHRSSVQSKTKFTTRTRVDIAVVYEAIGKRCSGRTFCRLCPIA